MAEAITFRVAHVGINFPDAAEAQDAAAKLHALFGLPLVDGSSSLFSGPFLELMKAHGRGTHGHLAIETNDLPAARALLEARGIAFAEDSIKLDNRNHVMVIYLQEEIGGFAIHLLQAKEGAAP